MLNGLRSALSRVLTKSIPATTAICSHRRGGAGLMLYRLTGEAVSCQGTFTKAPSEAI
jgi:hypothetical protein